MRPYKIAKPIPTGRSRFTIVESPEPGILGGTKSTKLYGRLDCPTALGWIARGHYVKNRVFFHSEEEAIACGFRPCHDCMRPEYEVWNAAQLA